MNLDSFIFQAGRKIRHSLDLHSAFGRVATWRAAAGTGHVAPAAEEKCATRKAALVADLA